MQVLSPTFPGLILICEQCGALLSYNKTDIYGANLVYCPLCKHANEIEYDKNYDGIVTEEKKDVQS
jgi:DNA-directed RNA polymerase subunit M/transcription elongation factor TFIIS